MRQIRCNIFETNSSSSHSLVIRSDSLMNELGEDIYFTHDEMLEDLNIKNGVYQSFDDDWYFGRFPFRALDTFELRFQYAYANFCYDENKLNELLELFKELVPEVKTIKEPNSAGTDDRCLGAWLSHYNISLREFLTNKKYIAIQDGDEYCIWSDLVKVGLIDTKSLENGDEVKNASRY